MFQHGWGFSSQCWSKWRELLASSCLCGDRGYWAPPRSLAPAGQRLGLTIDHGADPETMLRPKTASDCLMPPPPPARAGDLEKEQPGDRLCGQTDEKTDSAPGHRLPGLVLVCHSLGLHFLSQDLLVQAGILVIISGFAHFHGQDHADGRFTRKHIKKMLARLEIDPSGLISDFYRDCDCQDWPVHQGMMDTSRLTEDLWLLDQSRLDEKRCRQFPATLLLHGQDDRIVRPERAEELASWIARSQVTIVDGAGHGLPFTHPSLCLDLIDDFATSHAVRLTPPPL